MIWILIAIVVIVALGESVVVIGAGQAGGAGRQAAQALFHPAGDSRRTGGGG